MNENNIFVSIIIPIYNEEKHISDCIESILNQDYPLEQMELILIDGESSDNTVSIINNYLKQYKFIKLINNPERIVPYALNRAIEISKGNYIIRLDAHAIFPTNYISTLISEALRLDADNVGGVVDTLPANNTLIARSIALALKNPFGMGNSLFRTGLSEIKQVDTVPFGCFKKEIFEKIGVFDTDLIRNQDDEFNARIIQNGGKIFLLPDLVIKYFARDTFKKTGKMFYQYGLFKPLVNKKLKHPATLRQFVPPVFVLYIVLGFILSLLIPKVYIAYLIGLVLYFSASFKVALFNAAEHKLYLLLLTLPVIFLIIHVSYGIGYLYGILKFWIFNKTNTNIKVNR